MDGHTMSILAKFLDVCEGGADRAGLMATLTRVTADLGIEFFAAAFVPLVHERLDPYFIWDHWPPAWCRRYLKCNYIHTDPIVRILLGSGRPVRWSEALKGRAIPARAKRVMDEAKEFGLVDGLTIPLYTKSGIAGVFSLGGKDLRLSPSQITVLVMIAARAHALLLDAHASEPYTEAEPYVTKTESRCLTWCAGGMTDREIAMMTGRSPRTIQAHIYNLQRKFGVNNRAHLIAEAFRNGFQR